MIYWFACFWDDLQLQSLWFSIIKPCNIQTNTIFSCQSTEFHKNDFLISARFAVSFRTAWKTLQFKRKFIISLCFFLHIVMRIKTLVCFNTTTKVVWTVSTNQSPSCIRWENQQETDLSLIIAKDFGSTSSHSALQSRKRSCDNFIKCGEYF